MIKRKDKKHVHCPVCGRHLLTIYGNCDLEIICPKCRRVIVGILKEPYIMIFEERRA